MLPGIQNIIQILEGTPKVISEMISFCPEEFLTRNEGSETWSLFDIVGHLVHGEKTDWIPRMEIILSNADLKDFTPFDRFAQFNDSKGKNIMHLLNEFAALRTKNISVLKSKTITESDLKKTGIHPAFGEVTLEQLLSTWAVHDLNHISQIARVMTKQYAAEVGPWKEYLPLLK